ncbi:hypothetical protein [Microbacterium sp. SLBN-111]|uniref:hypothetical protein n=1 Tax=Microbacterium sp. SLBN-111 TaxID=3377733 RepID=UPI003C70A0FF
MIAAALLLVAVGGVDLLRRLIVGRRRIAFAIAGVVLVAVSAGADAIVAGLLAVAVAAIWTWVVPESGPARAGLWPVGLLGVAVAACVVVAPARPHPGILGAAWEAYGPRAGLSLDVVLLVAGCLLFLLESGNAVVRIALRGEMGERVLPDAGDAPTTLKGGRLIGPLERILVFALTLAGAYPLLAAVLAAKGIVRFPEISRDGDGGDRAEYFLIGSLVSWVTGLAAAFVVWWSLHAA